MTRREQLIEVFADTQRFYTENHVLAEAVKSSCDHTRFYDVNDYPVLPQGTCFDQAGNRTDSLARSRRSVVRVSKGKTFQTAFRLHSEHPDRKIAVLNFASATNPGGGVKNGSSAQEESLCRCSTLYPTLNRPWLWDKYYSVNRAARNVLHTDACIYSPNVIICKTDDSIPKRLSPDHFVTVDVITCAAPNLRKVPGNCHNPEVGESVMLTPQELYRIHLQRAKHILHVAAYNEVDSLVLGAFGCGAFANDPNIVAQAYHAAIEEYNGRFSEIEFAIYCRDYETENYIAFASQFGANR